MLHKWVTHEETSEKVNSDTLKDFVESKLLENIRDGDVASTILYLKTKGKDRGYVERQEIDASVNQVKRFSLIVKPDKE